MLVTGASGFVGRHAVRRLLEDGHAVRALVRPASLAVFARDFPTVEARPGDLREPASLAEACRGVDVVVHAAALMAEADWASAADYDGVNVAGTRHVVEAARGRAYLVHVSTVGVLGRPRRIPADEAQPYGGRLSRYERSKRDGEIVVRAALAEGGLRGTVLRPAQLYGPGMTYGWPDTARAIRDGLARIPGRGDARLHATHVADVVEAIRLVVAEPERAAQDVFNVAGPEALPIREVFGIIADAVGAPRPGHVPYPAALVLALVVGALPLALRPPRLRLLDVHRLGFFRHHHVYDVSKARRRLGYHPRIGIREGLHGWLGARSGAEAPA